MYKKRIIKGIIALVLSVALSVSSFAGAVSAEERTPSLPDLSGHTAIVIDSIIPKACVSDIVSNMYLEADGLVSTIRATIREPYPDCPLAWSGRR